MSAHPLQRIIHVVRMEAGLPTINIDHVVEACSSKKIKSPPLNWVDRKTLGHHFAKRSQIKSVKHEKEHRLLGNIKNPFSCRFKIKGDY